MGKRLLSCLLFFAMIITLSACSNQEEEQKAVQEVVQSYLTDCKNGDYKEADALLSEDADVSMNLTAFYEQLDDQLVNMDLGEDFDKEARKFVSAFMNKTFDQYKIDYIIDAIDSISSKKDLIAYALDRHIPFLSSMGMARKKDISKLKVMEVEQTSYDPIAKQIRVWKRKQKIREKIMVVSSTEIPVSVESGQPLPSMIFVPAAAGLLLADACIRYLSSHPQ